MAAALLAGSIAASSTWVGCGTDADGGPPSSPIADAAADMDVAEFGPHQVTYLTTIPDAFVGAYTIGIPANADPLTFQSSARLDIRSDAAFLTGGFGNMGFEKFRIESGD
ncbi:MAG TPA: hypothetical protein VF407_17690, partial [Polyangiaceae bacterium]